MTTPARREAGSQRRFGQVSLHRGVRLSRIDGDLTILDPSTGVDIVVPLVDGGRTDDDIMRILLANALGSAPRPVCRRLAADVGLDRRTRRNIMAFGTAHRILAPHPRSDRSAGARIARIARTVVILLIATSRGVLRSFGLASLLVATLTAITFVMARAPVGTVLWASAAPFLILSVVALHEGAHWAALRLVTAWDGALLIGRGCCAIVHPPLDGWRDRLAAGAGPLIGLTGAAVGFVIAVPDLAGASIMATLVLVNLAGLTPWSTDGARLLAARPHVPIRGVSHEHAS